MRFFSADPGQSRQQKLSVVLAAASLIAVAFGASASIGAHREEIERSRFVQCQARVNDQLVRALTARSEAAQTQNDATDRLIDTVFAAKSGEEVRQIYNAWKAARAATAKDRAANPLPAPPSDTCGGQPVGQR